MLHLIVWISLGIVFVGCCLYFFSIAKEMDGMTVKLFFTHTGKLIDFENLEEEDFCLEDIAHHLAKIQRYNGALPIDVSYTVGEHCINLSDAFSEMGFDIEHQAIALLHDASEAYIGDLFPGIKNAKYKELEHKIESLIYKKYLGKDVGDAFQTVLKYDKRIVLNEILTLNPEKYHSYVKVNPALPIDLSSNECVYFKNGEAAHVKKWFLIHCRDLHIFDTLPEKDSKE